MRIRYQKSVIRGQSLLCGLALCAFAAQAELTVTLKPEAASLFLYQPFRLLLDVSGEAETPTVPSAAGFTVTGIISTPFDKGISRFRIEIIPEEAGVLTVPPFTVQSGDETTETPLLRLAISTPRPADEMTLSTSFNTTHVVIDHPVEMTVTWKSKVSFTRCHNLKLQLPLLNNPAWEVYPLDPGGSEKMKIGLPVNAQRMIARNAKTEDGYELSFSCLLIPRREGVFRSETRLNCALQEKGSSSRYPSYFDNHFFNTPGKRAKFERIYLSGTVPELTVLALPDKGRTVRYSGIVGDCTAHAVIEPAETVVGQPMLLTVTLDNLPFGDHILNLPEATLDGLGPEFRITRKPIHVKTAPNARIFTYIVRPLRSGIETLPALSLDLFDPELKSYRTVRTAPLTITINPDGEQTVYTPSQSRTQPPLTPLNGIRNNRKESHLQMNTYRAIEFFAGNGWFFWLLPPLLWLLILRPWLRRRNRCRTDPAYARFTRALRQFRRTARQDPTAAWKGYLADRFNLHAEAVTFETIEPKFSKQTVSAELTQQVQEYFVQEDAARYAPNGAASTPSPSVRQLVRKIQATTRFLLLLACLIPALNSDAATADELFAQAMEIRTEKPDEAQPLFTEAALEFEADRAFLNAANSWFFAGENGRALADYRAAERRRPFDKQIRKSIAFIRTQRVDSFQVPDSFLSKRSSVWKRFCRRSPTLRFGVLTLIYLGGWIAFLIARFRGKAIPRKAWIIYGVHAAVIAFSLLYSALQPAEGVIIQATEMRLGPGYAYEPAYETILHEASEFIWLNTLDGWVLARLPDNSEAWLRETACVKIL